MTTTRPPIPASLPLVSCLCVTEGRAAFMPWLLWCFDRQSWPRRELIIVDSSPEPYRVEGRSDMRVVHAPPGSNVPRKRNLALDAASGDFISWFDDDDWQHPEKLTFLVEVLQQGAPYAGTTKGWFVDLFQECCTNYHSTQRRVLFNSAGFRLEAVKSLRFQENVRRASDTRWMNDLHARYHGQEVRLKPGNLFFWLCHTGNLSNPAARKHCSQPLDELRRLIGSEAWGDTGAALESLRSRLTCPEQQITARSVSAGAVSKPPKIAVEPSPGRFEEPFPDDEPAVGVMIKATVLDAPYLDVMVRHMIAQARYSFSERTIVVDHPRTFSGKYRNRPSATGADLDAVLRRLLEDDIIDSVREVDMSPTVVEEIMGRYFVAGAPSIQTHAVTGGPIYATLFGLESMSTDFVLQMDADVLFYTGPNGWVNQALQCMRRDPRLWLMMTHPGPPAGPPGRSLAGPNATRATWDKDLKIWRFQSATTRYFLCDRRQLRQRIHAVSLHGGCAPLEQCIGRSLQVYGACRGNLGDLHSWHLHAWHHGDPFPAWAPAIAGLVASGQVPALQRGKYDLRLDRPQDRLAWQRLVEAVDLDPPEIRAPATAAREPSAGGPATANDPSRRFTQMASAPVDESASTVQIPVPVRPAPVQHRAAETGNANQTAPIAVVIPVRNRAGQRLRNVLASLQWQTIGIPTQILVASHGSQSFTDQELAQICRTFGATLLTIGTPRQPWNKPLALNAGIRAVEPDVPYLMTLDADMILAPNLLEAVLERLERPAPSLVLCRSSDLPKGAQIPADPVHLLQAWERLCKQARLRGRHGTGGIQAARRSFFVAVRGYDEDLMWWGAMDGDMVNRARLAGLTVEWIEDRTTMLHQWHARKQAGLVNKDEILLAQQAWRHNHELANLRRHDLQRNPKGWGGKAEPDRTGDTALVQPDGGMSYA